MTYNTAFTNLSDGYMAYFTENFRHSDFSIGLDSAPVQSREQSLLSIITSFVLSYSLKRSMASVSCGLSTSAKKKKMRAKFNREAYEAGLKESLESKEQGVIMPICGQITLEDYSFHINETSGKVLTCCEVWYK